MCTYTTWTVGAFAGFLSVTLLLSITSSFQAIALRRKGDGQKGSVMFFLFCRIFITLWVRALIMDAYMAPQTSLSFFVLLEEKKAGENNLQRARRHHKLPNFLSFSPLVSYLGQQFISGSSFIYTSFYVSIHSSITPLRMCRFHCCASCTFKQFKHSFKLWTKQIIMYY